MNLYLNEYTYVCIYVYVCVHVYFVLSLKFEGIALKITRTLSSLSQKQ